MLFIELLEIEYIIIVKKTKKKLKQFYERNEEIYNRRKIKMCRIC